MKLTLYITRILSLFVLTLTLSVSLSAQEETRYGYNLFSGNHNIRPLSTVGR